MKIMMNDNWLGKMLGYPTNICVFGWGILWRLVAAFAVSALVIGYVWLWCLAFYDGFISGHHEWATAFVVWLIMTVIAGVGLAATKDYWCHNRYVKQFMSMCPQIEWDRGESK